MDSPSVEPTLRDLVARLDALDAENQRLRADLARFHVVANDAAPVPAETSMERLSRRWVLRRGMQAAAATALAGAVLVHERTPALAGQEQHGFSYFNATCTSGFCGVPSPVIQIAGDAENWGMTVACSTPDNYAIEAFNQGTVGGAIYAGAASNSLPALRAYNTGARGIEAEGMQTGVHASASASGYEGVYGVHTGTSGYGVVGDGTGGAAGVLGRNPSGTGVTGEGAYGIRGTGSGAGNAGVKGNNSTGIGVWGQGQTGVRGQTSVTGYIGVYGLHNGNGGYGMLGDGSGDTGIGVWGRNSANVGVKGEGQTGVVGETTTGGTAMHGINNGTGIGVLGDSLEGGDGVQGRSTDGIGVRGMGQTGVRGETSENGYCGVYALHSGSGGFGVLGDGSGATGIGVWGRNAANEGVRGEGKVGVHAKSTTSGGYGAVLEGGKAQLRLVPGSTAGKPTSGSHLKGELVMDKNAAIWVCTVAGTPGTWKKVTLS